MATSGRTVGSRWCAASWTSTAPASSTSAAASAPTSGASASSATTSTGSRWKRSASRKPAVTCRTSSQGVGEALPYPDDHFDLVFSNEVIEHVHDDRQTVAEMVRVTRPGGRDRPVRAQPALPLRDPWRVHRRPLCLREHPARRLATRPAPGPPRATRPGLHPAGPARTLPGPAGAPRAPPCHLPGLRQRHRPPPPAGRTAAARPVRSREHAAPRVRAVALPGRAQAGDRRLTSGGRLGDAAAWAGEPDRATRRSDGWSRCARSFAFVPTRIHSRRVMPSGPPHSVTVEAIGRLESGRVTAIATRNMPAYASRGLVALDPGRVRGRGESVRGR